MTTYTDTKPSGDDETTYKGMNVTGRDVTLHDTDQGTRDGGNAATASNAANAPAVVWLSISSSTDSSGSRPHVSHLDCSDMDKGKFQ